MPTDLTVTSICLLTSLGLVLSCRRVFRGTTLIQPFHWALFSLLTLLISEWLINLQLGPGSAPPLRYAAATTTVCPQMAVLGAKRPQHVAWQFVVLSLWIVLTLPVLETLIFWGSGALSMGAAREWFLAVLLFAGLSIYLPTRYGFAAALVCVGQVLLLKEHLPLVPTGFEGRPAGFALITGGTVVARWRRRPSRGGWDAVWLDFRDAFGTVWALRVRERVNATGRLCGWSRRLTWYGFVLFDEATGETEDRELPRAMRTLLRRFVSSEWIDRRLAART